MKELLYFGCIGDKGHYLWSSEGYSPHVYHQLSKTFKLPEHFFRSLDGMYIPTETRQQGIYRHSKIGEVQIIAWHDYSLDSRPGSNSTLIGIGFDDEKEMLDAAAAKFPSVMKRQERPKPLWV